MDHPGNPSSSILGNPSMGQVLVSSEQQSQLTPPHAAGSNTEFGHNRECELDEKMECSSADSSDHYGTDGIPSDQTHSFPAESMDVDCDNSQPHGAARDSQDHDNTNNTHGGTFFTLQSSSFQQQNDSGQMYIHNGQVQEQEDPSITKVNAHNSEFSGSVNQLTQQTQPPGAASADQSYLRGDPSVDGDVHSNPDRSQQPEPNRNSHDQKNNDTSENAVIDTQPRSIKSHLQSGENKNLNSHEPGPEQVSDVENTLRQASAPRDTTDFTVKVEWTNGMQPERWKKWLEMALQSWVSTELLKMEQQSQDYTEPKEKCCEITKVRPSQISGYADVTISPSAVLDGLLKQKSAKLMRKEHTAVVHFMPLMTSPQSPSVQQFTHAPATTLSGQQSSLEMAVPMTVTAEVDVNRFSPKALDTLLEKYNNIIKSSHNRVIILKGTLEEINMFYQELSKLKGLEQRAAGSATPFNIPSQTDNNENIDFRVPLFQYWYLNQAYSKEMHRIESKHNVTIKHEVFVSIKSNSQQSTRDDDLSKAQEEFQNLVQERSTDLGCVSIPPTHLESDMVKHILKNMQTDKAQMILSFSAEGCKLLAPKQQASMVERRLGLEKKPTKKVNFDIEVPQLSSRLSMDEIHWQLISTVHWKEMEEIKNKFGVALQHFQPSAGTVEVTAQPKEENYGDLKAHALRALTHLYQKVAMAAVTCTLKNPDQKTQDKTKEIIHSGHPFVGIIERNGSYRLVGLPVHLGPAVTEVEKVLSAPVFHNEEKQMIGYSGNLSLQIYGNKQSYESGYGNGAEGGAVYTGGTQYGAGKRRNTFEKEKESDAKQMEGGDAKEETCPICMDNFTDKKKLSCGHGFCSECLRQSVDSMGASCPVCKKIFGKVEGNQPDGTMNCHVLHSSLPGFSNCGTIVIDYSIPGGIQTEKHPNPGKPYYGTKRQAYLPDNKEGRHVLSLLRRAFDQKLIFTVGISRTTGADDSVTWNDIHHKTSQHGGSEGFGYPDRDYLRRVKEELKAKGIE